MHLKQLLKSVWLYGWVLIIPLALLASLTDLLLLGGVRLFLSMILESWNHLFDIAWLKNFDIWHWITLMLVIIILRYLFITLRARSEERLSRKLESHLRVWWLQTVKNLHPSLFHRPETKGILHSANLSVSVMPRGCKVVTQSIQAVSQLLFFLPVLFLISWQLTMILLFIFTPIVLYLQKGFKKISSNVNDFNQFSGDYDSNLWRWAALRQCWNNQEELSAYRTILFKQIRNLRDTAMRMGVRDASITQNIETLSISVMCIVLAICAVFIKTGIMEPFQIILFCAALFICYKPLKECSQLLSNIRDLKATYFSLCNLEGMERTRNFFKEQDEASIKIEDMAFKYGDNEPWIFQSLSNTVRLNRPVILQGPNGSGKTTLLRVLSGLEIPQGGNIFVPPKMKESFYLSQRLFLPPVPWLKQKIAKKEWSSTIKNFFDVLELDALLEKKGHSNGELQRIGLAWAVASGAPFLFLDEPFAFISQDLREPVFKAFWNTTAETGQWWMMASHEKPPAAYQEQIVYWKLT
ncbi:MAG: ABC transporter ATP-binding protein/permease [Fibromonadaceae bacterium]|jgi:ABC-type multidrug transport system fused ATPase/permease subunit|nr:ABC transporter ATP-binding protein/permease [Fibromonadaceae bacterium]